MALTSHCASIKYFFFFNFFDENSLSLVRDRFDLDCVREKPALGLRKKLGENTETASNVVGKRIFGSHFKSHLPKSGVRPNMRGGIHGLRAP